MRAGKAGGRGGAAARLGPAPRGTERGPRTPSAAPDVAGLRTLRQKDPDTQVVKRRSLPLCGPSAHVFKLRKDQRRLLTPGLLEGTPAHWRGSLAFLRQTARHAFVLCRPRVGGGGASAPRRPPVPVLFPRPAQSLASWLENESSDRGSCSGSLGHEAAEVPPATRAFPRVHREVSAL